MIGIHGTRRSFGRPYTQGSPQFEKRNVLENVFPRLQFSGTAGVNGAFETPAPYSPEALRRMDLYVAFAEKDPPLEKEDPMKQQSSSRSSSSFPENTDNDPEVIRGKLQRRYGVLGTKQRFTLRPVIEAPFEIPSETNLKQMGPRNTIEFTIPPLRPENVRVRKSKLSPFMDMTPGTAAHTLVKAGLQPSEIALEYQANWSKEKVSRDILQNFFDAHGKTLEGVHFKVETRAEGEQTLYKVRIDGLGQFDYEKSYILGASDKQSDAYSAGGYGEGLKIIALNLLRDYGALYVKVASANWAMTYSRPESSGPSGTARLFNHLEHLSDPAKQLAGNYFEFETPNPEMVASLFKAITYFYSPYHPDFQEQTYENEVGGFKLLKPQQGGARSGKGNVYVAMQRYEFEKKGAWDNPLEGFTVWHSTKLPRLAQDRDRTHIRQEEVTDILQRIIDKMTAEDVASTIRLLEGHWQVIRDRTMTEEVLIALIRKLDWSFQKKMEFPPHYVAYNLRQLSYGMLKKDHNESIELLQKEGYTLCLSEFAHIGMPMASDVLERLNPGSVITRAQLKAERAAEEEENRKRWAARTIVLSPQQKIRFYTLVSLIQVLSKGLEGSGLDRDQGLDVFLRSTSEFKYEWTDAKRQIPTFYIAPSTLEKSTLEEALFPLLAAWMGEFLSQREGTPPLTMVTMGSIFTKLLTHSKALLQQYQDWQALWALAGNPELFTADFKTILGTQTKEG